MSPTAATLVYDGECGICRYWVNYWQGLTQGRVVFRPYQEAAPDFPAIPMEAFQRAIQLIEADGHGLFGRGGDLPRAASCAGSRGVVVVLYDAARLRGASRVDVRILRPPPRIVERLTKLLWGPALQAERYALVSWIFLRLFGAIYVAAFASLARAGPGVDRPRREFCRCATTWRRRTKRSAARRTGCCPRCSG